jgi:hypothetical protein
MMNFLIYFTFFYTNKLHLLHLQRDFSLVRMLIVNLNFMVEMFITNGKL